MEKLFLFGLPRFEQAGGDIQIPRRKSLALLAYLAVTGQPHSRDTLATLFWPENDQSSARNNLRKILFELKTSIGEQNLRIDREQVGLVSGSNLWVDVNEFRTQFENARQHSHNLSGAEQIPLCTDCQDSLAHAVALYTADFMAGFNLPDSREFDEWQFFQAENLRQSLAEALQLLIQSHSEQDDYEPAIVYGRRWLALDPLHEPAHFQLMRLYAQAGQQAAALRQYQECVRILNDELAVEPEEETTVLFEAIRTRQFTARTPGISIQTETGFAERFRHNLPLQSTQITGRDDDLEQITGCLRDETDCRLLTLLGSGGIGKTRLAIEAAARLADDPDCPFCDGVWFVSLAGFSQADSIIPAIAEVIGLPLVADPEQRSRQLLDYLQPRRLLLVLDNFEHLLTAQSIHLLVDLLTHARQVKLLVTSRTRLNAHFERLLPVSHLKVPRLEMNIQGQSIDQMVTTYSAIQLFALRAQSIKADFAITSSNLEAVIQICRLVDGLPLGIELAAAWLEVLTPAEIAAEVEQCLDFLEASWPDRPERHHSLRAMFDSSWRLLAEAERAALMSLTIFQGSFSRQAAQAVSGASIHILLALQNKSWLQFNSDGRYQIHELLRQYAAEKLHENPLARQLAREKFGNYYAAFLDEQGERTKGPEQKSVFDAIAVEFENIRLAWQILVEEDKTDLAVEKMSVALYRYAEIRDKYFDLNPLLDLGIQWIAKDAGNGVKPELLAILLVVGAMFTPYGRASHLFYFRLASQEEAVLNAWRLSGGSIETIKRMGYWGILLCFLACRVDIQQAIEYLSQLQSYYRDQNRRWELANCLKFLAVIFTESGLYGNHPIVFPKVQEEAQQLLEEALMIFSELGDLNEGEQTREFLGLLSSVQEKYQEAIGHFKTALANLENVGDPFPANNIADSLAEAYQDMGDYASAFEALHAIRRRLEQIGDKTGVANALSKESLIALRYSSLEHARQTRQESLSLYQDVDNSLGVAWATWEMGEINRVAGDLISARDWFEKARLSFENLGDRTSSVFYERGLGDIAQMTGDYTEALKHFETSLQGTLENNLEWAQIYALCGMGRAELALGDTGLAMSHFSQALRTARKLPYREMRLLVLAGFASLFAATERYEQAAELGSLVASHKQTWNETKSQMEQLLQSITSLPPECFAAAQERGQALGINEAIHRFNL